ncbi:hypothetical protein CRYUN_Cryun31cG0111400 [Craigia yunnanensis]
MNEYFQVNRTNDISSVRETIFWKPPFAGFLKISTDAAFCSRTNIAKLGTVCRDSDGNVFFCAVAKRTEVFFPLQAELMAISYGLDIAREKGLSSIQVESDALLAVHEIEKGFSSSCE